MRWLIACLVALVLGQPVSAEAMQVWVSGDQLILAGPVKGGEVTQVTETLATHPEITTVILRNSPGGDIPTGYALGEMFRRKGLRTAVSGYCYSSCSRMFLGGRTRLFTNDFPADYTNVGFHGHYDREGLLNTAAVQRFGLKDWIIKYSDGKADPELVEAWVHLPLSRNMIHFYHPTALHGHEATTFVCRDNEPRVFRCQAVPGRHWIWASLRHWI